MYSEYRIHPARLTLLAACGRLVVVRSRLNCHTKNGKRRLAGPVRLYMYDCTLYFQTRCPEYTEKYSIQDPPVNGVCRGTPAYSKTLTTCLKELNSFTIRFFFYTSFSAPRSGICSYGGQIQSVSRARVEFR